MGKTRGSASYSMSICFTIRLFVSTFWPRRGAMPAGTSSLPVGMNATLGLRRTGTSVMPPMASAARSVGRMGRPAFMSGVPALMVSPAWRTFVPGSTCTSSSRTTEPSGWMAAFSIMMTAS